MQFAQAKEADGKLADAADVYERAGDADAAVRLYLHKLGNSNKAFALARGSGRGSAAATIAQYCVDKCDWGSAVEFHMLAGNVADALQVPHAAHALAYMPLRMHVFPHDVVMWKELQAVCVWLQSTRKMSVLLQFSAGCANARPDGCICRKPAS